MNFIFFRSDIAFTSSNNSPSVSLPRSPAPMQTMLASFSNSHDNWFFDTEATHHLSNDINQLTDVQPYMGFDQVTIGDGNSLPILRTSNNKHFPTSSQQFSLRHVLHVPQLFTNLISVSRFCTDNNVFFRLQRNQQHFCRPQPPITAGVAINASLLARPSYSFLRSDLTDIHFLLPPSSVWSSRKFDLEYSFLVR